MSEREILHLLHRIEERQEEIMGDLTALNAAVAQLQTDVGTLITDFQAESDQADIDATTAAVTDLDNQVQAVINPTPVAPTVTAVSPTSGPVAGGTTVAVTGTGFTGATAVNFGSTPAPSFTVASDTWVSAVSPATDTADTVDITVVTADGTSATSPADQFTTS
jgi:outer membrane murein-binding lipoprotein Lpp